jgi:hypothetical protein
LCFGFLQSKFLDLLVTLPLRAVKLILDGKTVRLVRSLKQVFEIRLPLLFANRL